LLKNKNKIILISHLGSPQKLKNGSNSLKISGKQNHKELKDFSLMPVYLKLKELLDKNVNKIKSNKVKVARYRKIKFLNNSIGKNIEEESKKMKEGEILFLENLRFYKEEEKNNDIFAKKLSKIAEIYINDAFAVSHRKHASIVGIPNYLPSYAGLLFEKEVKALSKVFEKSLKPLAIIIGGAKVSNKGGFIKKFLKIADNLLIGGKVANSILCAKGICGKVHLFTKKTMKEINQIDLTSVKLHIPMNVIVSPTKNGDIYIRETSLGEVKRNELILDIGPETIKIFSDIIKESKIIVWAGPLGLFENPLFENGTKSIAKEITKNSKAFKIAGGGQTIFALSKFGFKNKFNHISTGGGAMLKFLSGEKLPGIKALEQQSK
ncbi:MAG: phosphoglycerate kinase, partial [Patescibacteria group bacterium]|nr:phosphoglycerate kinase [Patescibacteria group bacterium]